MRILLQFCGALFDRPFERGVVHCSPSTNLRSCSIHIRDELLHRVSPVFRYLDRNHLPLLGHDAPSLGIAAHALFPCARTTPFAQEKIQTPPGARSPPSPMPPVTRRRSTLREQGGVFLESAQAPRRTFQSRRQTNNRQSLDLNVTRCPNHKGTVCRQIRQPRPIIRISIKHNTDCTISPAKLNAARKHLKGVPSNLKPKVHQIPDHKPDRAPSRIRARVHRMNHNLAHRRFRAQAYSNRTNNPIIEFKESLAKLIHIARNNPHTVSPISEPVPVPWGYLPSQLVLSPVGCESHLRHAQTRASRETGCARDLAELRCHAI